jgi:preprotein translocase subunit SecA
MSIRRYDDLRDQFLPRAHKPRRCDRQLVRRINTHAAELTDLPDQRLADRTADLRELTDRGVPATDARVAVPAFALVTEATRRTLGMSPYDVQLLAGIALAAGAVAEMQTGEGKTLTSTLPAALHAITGEGVHVATVNRYLAERDYQLLQPVYERLGLTVGLAADGAPPDEKRAAYACDVTYATGYELGFDFLRDELVRRRLNCRPPGIGLRDALRGNRTGGGDTIGEDTVGDNAVGDDTVQRGHALAIVDEVDSVLIDEANTPLILSGPAGGRTADTGAYLAAARIAEQLEPGQHFSIDPQTRQLRLNQAGADAVQSGRRPYRELARPWTVYIEQALRARHLFRRNVHYVVHDGEVRIVDEYTGRIFAERTWRDGLHQAVEAKEGVEISAEKRSLARIARQRCFQMYQRLCGMTGTAVGHERELQSVYRLPLVVIPLRKTSQRRELATRYFAGTEAKWDAIAREIADRHRRGQPVLVGTRTIANSLLLADKLKAAGLPFRVLNGVQDEDEAELIAGAGESGSVTIATNMAGRGTDIQPTPEALAAGGLHVIAAERHDSQRIDRQLVGRTARQGDPGTCRFYVSAEDELLQRYDPSLAEKMRKSVRPDGELTADFSAAIATLQRKAERDNYESRSRLMRQELWLNEVLNTVA